jgi:hypothetical protein
MRKVPDLPATTSHFCWLSESGQHNLSGQQADFLGANWSYTSLSRPPSRSGHSSASRRASSWKPALRPRCCAGLWQNLLCWKVALVFGDAIISVGTLTLCNRLLATPKG